MKLLGYEICSNVSGCDARQAANVQYATGSGSSERHMYQVATLRQGCQAPATSRASLRLTG